MALFLRMVCSPEGSLEQIALLTLKGLAAPWYRDAVADLRLILPGLHLATFESARGSFLRSNWDWNEVGEWMGCQPPCMYVEAAGQGFRQRPPCAIRQHVKRLTRQLECRLRRGSESHILHSITEKASISNYSKFELLGLRFQRPGPPLHMALGWVEISSNRSAVAALFCGDLSWGATLATSMRNCSFHSVPHTYRMPPI